MTASRKIIQESSLTGERVLSYREFLAAKHQRGAECGFEPSWMPDFLFPFQRDLFEWAVNKGRGAIFADCGLGKTPIQLVWAENVARKTNGRVLIVTPLAVSMQTCREGEKFGIECRRVDTVPNARLSVTNYERLHHLDPSDFVGVVCDESSAIKALDGVRRAKVTEFLRTIPYRLMCTATAAPNDYIELGTASEALGVLGQQDMISQFFVDASVSGSYGSPGSARKGPRFRFKGHAETPFWRWVCSWAKACRKPSDLGFSDDGFVLPPLIEREHVIETTRPREGMLFPVPARDWREERQERRDTISERCEKAAELVAHSAPAVIWCHYNAEGDRLEKIIPGALQVSGRMSDQQKEESFERFASGDVRVLITKPKIGAFGLNWQHCAHVVMFATHSYEQYYQGVRRCWRFGQSREVVVDLIATEGERGIRDNLRRKAAQADEMFQALVRNVRDYSGFIDHPGFDGNVEVPRWL